MSLRGVTLSLLFVGIATASSCTDGIQNGDEESIDCGGSCDGCGLSDVEYVYRLVPITLVIICVMWYCCFGLYHAYPPLDRFAGYVWAKKKKELKDEYERKKRAREEREERERERREREEVEREERERAKESSESDHHVDVPVLTPKAPMFACCSLPTFDFSSDSEVVPAVGPPTLSESSDLPGVEEVIEQITINRETRGLPLEVLICMDQTESVFQNAPQVRQELARSARVLFQELGADFRLGFIAFAEYTSGLSSKSHESWKNTAALTLPFTDDAFAVYDFLISLGLGAGSKDSCQAYEYALQKARSFDWTPGSTHVVIMVGDESPHTARFTKSLMEKGGIENPRFINWTSELKHLSEASIAVHGLQLYPEHTIHQDFYKACAGLTGGLYLPVQMSNLSDLIKAIIYYSAGDTKWEDFKSKNMMKPSLEKFWDDFEGDQPLPDAEKLLSSIAAPKGAVVPACHDKNISVVRGTFNFKKPLKFKAVAWQRYRGEPAEFLSNRTADTQLKSVAKLLKKHSAVRVEVQVHMTPDANMDTPEEYEIAEKITQARADLVMEKLVELGVPAENVEALGMGAWLPVLGLDGAIDSSKCERVVINML